jgi:hypothetical protein
MARLRKTSSTPEKAAAYRHPESGLPARPEIGARAHFKKTKTPITCRFNSSLAPEADPLKANDVSARFLDTDYNGMVFRVRQAFFPRTGAWENLNKSLRVEFEDTVWDHLASTTRAPFPAGEHNQIAVKVIDARRNEMLVVKKLEGVKYDK